MRGSRCSVRNAARNCKTTRNSALHAERASPPERLACAQAATCEANLEEAAPLPPNPSADMAADAHAPETTPNANSADNVSPTHAATNPGSPSDAPAGEASNQTLKSAVKQTTQRSRRRVPLVVLVALALALAAGTAYAAYRVYVDVIAPSQQPAQTEQAIQGGDQAKRARPARRK